MSTPITPDERAEWRERFTADLTRLGLADYERRVLLGLGRTAREVVPRLLDALEAAEARGRMAETNLTVAGRALGKALAKGARTSEENHPLRAAPAPMWDEDTVTEAACQAVTEVYERHGDRFQPDEEEVVAAVLAVVLEHLPVFAADIDGLASEIFEHSHEPALPDDENGMTEARSRAIHYFQTYVEQGGSRSEVEASALHDAARAAVSDNDDCIPWDNDHDRATVATWLRTRADRLKKRADRG